MLAGDLLVVHPQAWLWCLQGVHLASQEGAACWVSGGVGALWQLLLRGDDWKRVSRSSCQVVLLVEGEVALVERIKVTQARVEGENVGGAGKPWVELSERDRAENLTIITIINRPLHQKMIIETNGAENLTSDDSVHPNSVEVIRSDFHVRAAKQENGQIVEFCSDKVKQLKLGWCATFCLERVPEQVGTRVFLLVLLADLQGNLLHLFIEVGIVVLL